LTGNSIDFSLVIPAYNEANSLPAIIEEYKLKKEDIRFQLIIVDNGSTDNTANVLDEFKKKKEFSFLTIATVNPNIGYGNGIYQGLLQAKGSVVGWTHADMQTPVEDPFRAYNIFIREREKGNKTFVKGHRRKRSFLAKVITTGLQIFSFIILGTRFDDINGQPKVFDKLLIDKMNNHPLEFSFDTYVQYIAKKNGYTVNSIPVDFKDRKFGTSSWATSFINRIITILHYMRDIVKMRKSI